MIFAMQVTPAMCFPQCLPAAVGEHPPLDASVKGDEPEPLQAFEHVSLDLSRTDHAIGDFLQARQFIGHQKDRTLLLQRLYRHKVNP
jgi:hypothetical protein